MVRYLWEYVKLDSRGNGSQFFLRQQNGDGIYYESITDLFPKDALILDKILCHLYKTYNESFQFYFELPSGKTDNDKSDIDVELHKIQDSLRSINVYKEKIFPLFNILDWDLEKE